MSAIVPGTVQGRKPEAATSEWPPDQTGVCRLRLHYRSRLQWACRGFSTAAATTTAAAATTAAALTSAAAATTAAVGAAVGSAVAFAAAKQLTVR